MNDEILFSERQKFKQWQLRLLLLCINGLLWFGVFKQIAGGQPFGSKPLSDEGLIFAAAMASLISLLFLIARLDTTIKQDGVYVQFFPFHLKPKHYDWNDVTKSYVRQYSPLTEYGGWGLRIGFFGKGAAFNVSGNKGLQLEFTNNKKLLVGTNKPDELTEALNKIGRLKQ